MSDLDLVDHLPPGIVLNQRYRLEKALGAGGFGITYLATDTALDRTVAVKELYPQMLYRVDRDGTSLTVPRSKKDGHSNLVRRIIKQGHLFRSFEHPNLVDIYEAFLDNNTAYLVMAFLEGRDVSSLLAEHERLPEADVKQLMHDVSSGLRYMHERGAYHLDIKPSNIFYTDGKYVVIDYGESKTVGSDLAVNLSTGGHTEGFMALEQADANMDKGPFTDLYAFGVTLYLCLTGQRPPPFYARMANAKMEPLVLDDAGLQRQVEWAMEVLPEDRPQTVDAWFAPETPTPEPEPEPPTIIMDDQQRQTLQEQLSQMKEQRQRTLQEQQQDQQQQQFDPFRPDTPVRPDPVRPDPVRPDPVRPDPTPPEPVPVQKVDVGKRFGAFFFDSLIGSGIGLLFVGAFGDAFMPVGYYLDSYSGTDPYDLQIFGLFSLGWSVFLLFRDRFKGGSWGKKLLKLRLERLDGQPLSASESFKRNWMWGLGILYLVPDESWMTLVMVVIVGFMIVEVMKISSDPEGRRLGDRWAGTRVVAQTRPARRA